MSVTTGSKLLEPIHIKVAISVFFSSKVYSAQVMPAKYLFLWDCYVFLPLKIGFFFAEQFKLDLLIMFLRNAFFNTFFGQCQKTALEAKKTTLISLTT